MNIDKHLDEHLANLPQPPAGLSKHKLTLFKICNTYKAVKPVLLFVRKLLIVKPKWRAALDILIAALDTACP